MNFKWAIFYSKLEQITRGYLNLLEVDTIAEAPEVYRPKSHEITTKPSFLGGHFAHRVGESLRKA